MRTWSQPRRVIEGSAVKDLHGREAFERKANAITACTTEAEVQQATMIRRVMLIGGERTALELDSLFQKDWLDRKCAAGGPLAHGAVAREYLKGSPADYEANLAA